eukprot:1639608-Amphidinium_carterae.1
MTRSWSSVSAQCGDHVASYSYYNYEYYYVCSYVAVRPSMHALCSWVGPFSALVLLSVWAVAVIYLWRLCAGSEHCLSWSIKSKVAAGVALLWSDLARVGRLLRFAVSELIWIASHYLCCARRRFRAAAMRMRPYVIASEDTGEEFVFSPARSEPAASTARLSLADIQLQIAGGRALRAHRCKQMRFVHHRRRCFVVTYSPQRAGHCLFAVLAEACRIYHGRTVSVSCLRRVLQRLLLEHDHGEVERVARFFGSNFDDYLAATTRSRWGTSFDFKLLARELELPISLVNRHTGMVLVRNAVPGRQLLVGFRDSHFTLVRTAKPLRSPSASGAKVKEAKHVRARAGRHVRGGDVSCTNRSRSGIAQVIAGLPSRSVQGVDASGANRGSSCVVHIFAVQSGAGLQSDCATGAGRCRIVAARAPAVRSGSGVLIQDSYLAGGSGGQAKRGLSPASSTSGGDDRLTLYRPPQELSQHYLLASVLFVAGIPVSLARVHQLRVSIALLLRSAYNKQQLLAGQPLELWAHSAAMSADEYIHRTYAPHFRSSTTLDAYLAAEILGMSLWVADSNDLPWMCSHPTSPRELVIRQDEYFFVVDRSGVPVAPDEFFCAKVSALPPQLLDQPRSGRMLKALQDGVNDQSLECILQHHCFHAHLTEIGAHVRLLVAVPAFNYVLLAHEVLSPQMILTVNQMPIYRHIGRWTAAVRLLAEVETADDEVDTFLSVYAAVDQMIQRYIIEVYRKLMCSVTPESEQARLACQHVLHLTLNEHLDIFEPLLDVMDFSVFPVETAQLTLKTFAEYQQCLTRLGLSASVAFFLIDTELPPFVDVPVLVLTENMLSCLRQVVWKKWGVELRWLPSTPSPLVCGGAQQSATVLDKSVNPFLTSCWYARALWRDMWVR